MICHGTRRGVEKKESVVFGSQGLHKLAVGLVVTSMAVLAGCSTTAPSGAPAPQLTSAAAPAPATSATPSPSATETTPTPTPEPSSQAPSAPAPAPTTSAASPSPSATASTPAAPAPADVVLAPGATGDKVRELQARLSQLDWFEGKITPSYDEKTKDAVTGFQNKRTLPANGIVDTKTWASLTTLTRQPTSDEMNNVIKPGPALLKAGDTGDKVRDLQVRLRQLEWYAGAISGTYDAQTVAGVKGFQGKRELPATGEVDQRTLDRLSSMTRKPSAEEMTNATPSAAPAPAATGVDDRCKTGRALCIDKTTRKLRWMVDGQVVRTFDVRFGSELTPTREGSFVVNFKSRDHVSTIYNTPMPFAMFFSGGQAVHYSADFAARGYNGASHGCVNVRDRGGIAWLFDQVNTGERVIVYRS